MYNKKQIDRKNHLKFYEVFFNSSIFLLKKKQIEKPSTKLQCGTNHEMRLMSNDGLINFFYHF